MIYTGVMNETPQQRWKERTQGDGAAFIERLTRLQNRHRLLIHMVEPHGAFFEVDDKTLKDLSTPAEEIPERLRAGRATELSMSLVPSQQAGIGMAPYEVAPWEMNHYGYLFSFDQNQPHAPRVLRVHDYSLNSGSNNAYKHLHLGLSESMFDDYYVPLRDPYRQATWQQDVKRAMGGPDGSRYAGEQLTMLGEQIVKGANDYCNKQRVAQFNEVVVSASASHIQAIVVPFYKHDVRIARLQAALAALDHHRIGIPLPAVLYHVHGPEQGNLTLVGQTKEELEAVALESLKELGAKGLKEIYLRFTKPQFQMPETRLTRAVGQCLGIDIGKPAEGADGWMVDVEDRLDELNAKAASVPKTPGARTP